LSVTIVLSVVAIALLYLAARHLAARPAEPAADTALHSLDWLARANAAEFLAKAGPTPTPDGWESVTVSELSRAEELLDRAEAAGYEERELVVLGNSTFLVRWRHES
jgi:hypothetical protein